MKLAPLGHSRRGVILVVALVALLVVGLTGAQLLRSLTQLHRQARQHAWQLQAIFLADSGLERAIARLQADADYAGETWLPPVPDAAARTLAGGRVEITVTKKPSPVAGRNVRIVATFPDDPLHRARETREKTLTLNMSGDSP